jgi:hypothetical protein
MKGKINSGTIFVMLFRLSIKTTSRSLNGFSQLFKAEIVHFVDMFKSLSQSDNNSLDKVAWQCCNMPTAWRLYEL